MHEKSILYLDKKSIRYMQKCIEKPILKSDKKSVRYMQKCIGIPYQNQMKNLYDTCINALKCIVHSDKKSVP